MQLLPLVRPPPVHGQAAAPGGGAPAATRDRPPLAAGAGVDGAVPAAQAAQEGVALPQDHAHPGQELQEEHGQPVQEEGQGQELLEEEEDGAGAGRQQGSALVVATVAAPQAGRILAVVAMQEQIDVEQQYSN